jgi:hypothetical protein
MMEDGGVMTCCAGARSIDASVNSEPYCLKRWEEEDERVGMTFPCQSDESFFEKEGTKEHAGYRIETTMVPVCRSGSDIRMLFHLSGLYTHENCGHTVGVVCVK